MEKKLLKILLQKHRAELLFFAWQYYANKLLQIELIFLKNGKTTAQIPIFLRSAIETWFCRRIRFTMDFLLHFDCHMKPVTVDRSYVRMVFA